MVKSQNLTLKYVIDADSEVDTVLETEIDEGAGCVMFYKPRVFGAMIGVVPLIRGQQQLTKHIRQTLFDDSLVVLWFQSECRYYLEHQHQQLLWRKSCTAEQAV
jgi:hypothetical protein